MIKISKSTPEHFEKIKPRGCHGTEHFSFREDALTFLKDDEPLAIFGGYLITDGLMQIWAIVSDSVSSCPLSFHKASILLLQHYIDMLSLRRVQISVRTDFLMGWKWAKSLGFECEGTMRQYGQDGSSYWLFAKVKS